MELTPARLLCPTDFSEAASVGVSVGIGWARRFGAKVTLIHVVEHLPVVPPPPLHSGPMILDAGRVERQFLEHAKENLEQRRNADSDVVDEIVVRQGPPADEIARLAKEERVDLIVLATHGRGGWRQLVFGSVVEKLVRISSTPMLIVPTPEDRSETQEREA